MAYAVFSVVFGEQPSAAKWNILGTNDSSFNDGTGIADSKILPKHLLTGTGSAWAWQSFTTTWVNWTVGTGGSAGTTSTYTQIGKTVFYYIKSFLGTSGQSVGTGVSFTFPVTPSTNFTSTSTPMGQGWGTAAATAYPLQVRYNAGVGLVEFFLDDTGTASQYVGRTATSSTVPNTWAANDFIIITGFYEAA